MLRIPQSRIVTGFTAGICLVYGSFLVWQTFVQPGILNQTAKVALSEMHEGIQLGISMEDVEYQIELHRHVRHRVRHKAYAGSWKIGMPFEFGCGDWELYVFFDKNEKVKTVAIRTSDGIHSRPQEAPDDKGLFPGR